MANRQTLEGDWNRIRGKLRSKWGKLTNDELEKFKGNSSQLVGLIQRKTGEAREDIEDFLQEVSEKSSEGVSRAASTAAKYASNALDAARNGVDEVADHAREGYEVAEQTVQDRPMQSVALAFGAGLVAGIVAMLFLRSDR